MQTKKLLLTLFEYKAWANQDLFRLMASVSVDTYAREMHDAIRILNHIHVVDQIFAANLQSQSHGFTALNTPDTPALDDLHQRVSKTDQWFLDYLGQQPEASFGEEIHFTFVDGKPGMMSRGEMLLHVATHGNYHRGAVGRILFQIGVQPPRDTMTVYLHQTARIST
ncbi:DinB family protein [Undibacterium sp. CY18W]|uniref:DinB family protein n=1 Tax=Undibacterium hunanense TaxID=2762292 RepID=A0ABR6ZLZ0_9BURK|nr:DinB family protein [Undibacterium hunanense]MBC3916907.1 DinB family protein [Undibacterium hunanense]